MFRKQNFLLIGLATHRNLSGARFISMTRYRYEFFKNQNGFNLMLSMVRTFDFLLAQKIKQVIAIF
jgi:hypothetical protein